MTKNLSLIGVILLSLSPFFAFSQNTQIKYLSGNDKDNTVNWEFFIDRGMNSGKWSTIPVPSNWELQGFGVYNYGRGKQPESDETGQYRYRFDVASDWKGKTINIVFEGSMTDTHVKINGKFAGEVHQGSFYRFKYDISKLLKYGEENLLEVTVKNWSENASVNTAEREADFWLFGGIYRPVYLEALPKQHIEWTAIDAKADGSFLVNVYLKNIRSANKVSAQIQTIDGEKVGSSFSQKTLKGAEMVTLKTKIDNPKLWSPEFPSRYKVVLSLKKDEEITHTITEKFGFRTVELRKRDGFYVNGVKVKFKGVNRHSHWPESGRTTSRKLSVIDVNLMKEMNMNAVRMSHYPPDKHFLEVCDSVGLFVLDEVTGWQTMYDTEVGRKLVKETVVRDVNHPSVVIWDNGNEGGNNTELDDDFHLYDPQKRPVIHPWENFRGTDTNHYRHYNCCVDQLYHGKEVFFPTEFLHGIYDGGHGAGLADNWKLMQEHPLSAGMFLWVFADEGTVRSDKNGELDLSGSNAPDGIVGPYREKEGSFFTIKEVWSPVQPTLKMITDSFDGNLLLENYYLYTNLSNCKFSWQLVNYPDPYADLTAQIMETGEVPAPFVDPGERGKLFLNLPDNWRNHDALNFTATDFYGKEIYTWTWPIKRQEEYTSNLIKHIKKTTSFSEDNSFVTLTGNGTEVKIDKKTGQINQVTSNGTPISFKNGPIAEDQLGPTEIIGVSHEQQGTDHVVEFEFSDKSIFKKLRYQIMSSGLLKLEVEYLPKSGFYDYVGIDFSYPEEKVKSIKWLGDGPYRVWKNRTQGVRLGIWEKDYNNTITGETEWVYPEFKGYHSQLYWAVIDNTEKPFAIINETQDIALKLFNPDEPEGAYNTFTDGSFSKGDISLMHGISPIGTKFREAKHTGPSGDQNMIFYNRNPTNLSFTVYFDFDL